MRYTQPTGRYCWTMPSKRVNDTLVLNFGGLWLDLFFSFAPYFGIIQQITCGSPDPGLKCGHIKRCRRIIRSWAASTTSVGNRRVSILRRDDENSRKQRCYLQRCLLAAMLTFRTIAGQNSCSTCFLAHRKGYVRAVPSQGDELSWLFIDTSAIFITRIKFWFEFN